MRPPTASPFQGTAAFPRPEAGAAAPRPRILTTLGAKAAEEAGIPLPPPESEFAPELAPLPIPSESGLPVINLTSPLPTSAELAQRVRESAAPAASVPPGVESEVTAKPAAVSAAALGTFATLFKFIVVGGILLGGAFYLSKSMLLPFYQELRNPKKDSTVDRQATAAVQVLQQTRKVVAESHVRLAKLNDIVDGTAPNEAAAQPAVPPPLDSPRLTAVRPPVTKAASEDRLYQIQLALDAMKITGVTGGSDPRAVVDGRMVKFGDIVDYRLGLRFVEVNEEVHEVRFIDADGTMYRRVY